MDYYDKRLEDFMQPRVIISSIGSNLKRVQINEGNISVRMPTTCCIYTDGTSACESKSNTYQTVPYEFIFETNFGQRLSNQNISLTLNCE